MEAIGKSNVFVIESSVFFCFFNSINFVENALLEQLPPPPQIELVVDKPHLMNVLRRPLVRIRRKSE